MLFQVVFLLSRKFSKTTLLQILSQEIDSSVDINRAYKGNQFEIQLFRWEWEQKGTVLENLLHFVRDGALNQVNGVFDASLQVRV